jgi:hypothetical protein
VAVAAAAGKAEPGLAVKAGANGLQQQQSALVKQEVKQEQHLSRSNSDSTLGISADQEANVGLRCLSSWPLRSGCNGCNGSRQFACSEERTVSFAAVSDTAIAM